MPDPNQMAMFEVDEIQQEDLEAAADKFDAIQAAKRAERIHKRAKNAKVTIPGGKTKPKNKFDVPKIIAGLEKKIIAGQKKADSISTEVSGNWTRKRAAEADYRRNKKEKLESYIMALTNIKEDWKKNNCTATELEMIRSIPDIEFILYSGYPTAIDDETPDWRIKEYPARLKKANKLGIFSHDGDVLVRSILKDYMTIDVSEEQKKAKELAKAIRDIRGLKIPGFFPTPDALIEKMFEYGRMHEKREMLILEPSAGIGNIADKIQELDYGHKLRLVEINYNLCKILELKGYEYLEEQSILSIKKFKALDNSDASYDRIIMNPPFEKGQAIKHIEHCFNNFLGPNGILVSIASNAVMTNTQKKYVAFQELVAKHGQFVKLEGEEFKGAHVFNQTGTSTVMVVLRKEE